MRYDGGESSRIYVGDYRVLIVFIWANGQPGWDYLPPMKYEDAMILCRCWGQGMPHQTGSELVRVERALITTS